MQHLEVNTIIDLNEGINREKIKKPDHSLEDELKKSHKHKLVKKCLKEIAYLYKLAALIEIAIFLALSIIFFMFYFFETDVSEFYITNERLKNQVFRYNDVQKIIKNVTLRDNSEIVFDILRTSFNYEFLRRLVN